MDGSITFLKPKSNKECVYEGAIDPNGNTKQCRVSLHKMSPVKSSSHIQKPETNKIVMSTALFRK